LARNIVEVHSFSRKCSRPAIRWPARKSNRSSTRGTAPTRYKKLNKSFITPLDREDIYALSAALDDILDLIDASAQRIVMYNVEKPTPEAKELAFLILNRASLRGPFRCSAAI
jgi:hypothetical protein